LALGKKQQLFIDLTMNNISEGYSYDDLLLVPKTGVLDSRKDADISSELVPGVKLDVPIIGANMPSVMSPEMAYNLSLSGAIGVLHRFNTIAEQMQEYKISGKTAAVAIGLKDGFERTYRLCGLGCEIFVLDIAHGHSQRVLEFVEAWKNWFPFKLIVGNVATEDGTWSLLNAGADGIKVGIGPGAACTTREVTGFGVPQLTAIAECSNLKNEELNYCVIADGGIRNSGDIVKALAAGADTVMIGSLLAGANESPNPGEYYGNASFKMNGHNAPEGVEGNVAKSGTVENIIKKLAWGIRSGISYGGGTDIESLRKNAEWIRSSNQTMKESGTRI
jgi:IMP dehydrogenase